LFISENVIPAGRGEHLGLDWSRRASRSGSLSWAGPGPHWLGGLCRKSSRFARPGGQEILIPGTGIEVRVAGQRGRPPRSYT
jgi:hypothetical protein